MHFRLQACNGRCERLLVSAAPHSGYLALSHGHLSKRWPLRAFSVCLGDVLRQQHVAVACKGPLGGWSMALNTEVEFEQHALWESVLRGDVSHPPHCGGAPCSSTAVAIPAPLLALLATAAVVAAAASIYWLMRGYVAAGGCVGSGRVPRQHLRRAPYLYLHRRH